MIPAPKPDDENKRLAALQGFEVLDTPPEEAFDELTRLASEICGTRIALVSLIDSDRQWFKSKVGLDADETPRDLAFCAHAILDDKIFEISDASKDERFHDNPLVTEAPDIRFYAGAPLITSKGDALGTLCVIDPEPGELNDMQRRTLQVLGNQVIAQLELRLVARRALDLSTAKSRFLASMSHELRTPMNAILGFSSLLKKETLAPKAEKYIERVHEGGLRLLAMINDILDLSKVEAGKINLRKKPVDLRQLCQGLVEELEVVAQSGVKLSLECAMDRATLETDPERLRQVLVNLVGNALKFTAQGTVVVSIECDSGGRATLIRVADSGIGMDANQLEAIFEPFVQADAGGGRSYEGTGLGLALARQLSREMGYKLSVTSEAGKGSIFSLVL